ncbi:MAG: Cyclic di-GMP phosphodiesterase [Phycisphaerae bacterium]|nr:Cyclic di-GMP phosphodiesterase [Phycisphaerae bacterium]
MNAELINVLVLDAEPLLHASIATELADSQAACTMASGVEGACELLRTRPFDALIVDTERPGPGVAELLTTAARVAPDCRVVLVAGAEGRDGLAQGIMMGAEDYVEKPFKPGELAEVLHKVLGGTPSAAAWSLADDGTMQWRREPTRAALAAVRQLVLATEARDPLTRRHHEHVAHYATGLAELIGLSRAQVESIRIAALVHDVGKMSVPIHILLKQGRLNSREFEYIRRHPEVGADLLANLTLFKDEADLVRHHHESWDGRGYPDGLACREIPVGARIIHVADAMDGMLMSRTYKRAYSTEEMLSELIRCAGTQYDRDVASAAIRWCAEHPDQLILPVTDAASATRIAASVA